MYTYGVRNIIAIRCRRLGRIHMKPVSPSSIINTRNADALAEEKDKNGGRR
jgi:hypothetical protein